MSSEQNDSASNASSSNISNERDKQDNLRYGNNVKIFEYESEELFFVLFTLKASSFTFIF